MSEDGLARGMMAGVFKSFFSLQKKEAQIDTPRNCIAPFHQATSKTSSSPGTHTFIFITEITPIKNKPYGMIGTGQKGDSALVTRIRFDGLLAFYNGA